MKKCKKCEKEKDLDQFYKCIQSLDGHKLYCKACISIQIRSNYINNPSSFKNRSENYAKNNTEKVKEINKAWLFKNKNKKAESNKRWKVLNKVKENLKDKTRYSSDPIYKLSMVLRARLNMAIKNNIKTGSAISDLGCSIVNLKLHLESLFEPGMSWDNWSRTGWHIDHKIPLSSFNLSNREELLKATHYTNLQPLWAKDNLKKSSKI